MNIPMPVVENNDAPGSVPTPSPAPAPEPAQAPAPAPSAEPGTPAQSGGNPDGSDQNGGAPKPPAAPDASGLVELPDGRKVDVKTAEREYRNLLADHTRKSQQLAEFRKGGAGDTPKTDLNNPVPKKPWEDPEWTPKSYAEILEVAAMKIKDDAEREKALKESQDTHLASVVDTQVAELKKLDPALNEMELFKHASKYGFGINIKGAYQNMKDLTASIRKASEIAANNIAKRNSEPVNGGSRSGAIVSDGDVYDPNVRNTSLADHLRTIKP